jgi:hypothetical protein
MDCNQMNTMIATRVNGVTAPPGSGGAQRCGGSSQQSREDPRNRGAGAGPRYVQWRGCSS